MRDLTLKIRWQVDDGYSAEGATLRADAATDAELLGDEGDTRFRRHLERQMLGRVHPRSRWVGISDAPRSKRWLATGSQGATGGCCVRRVYQTARQGTTSCTLDGISIPVSASSRPLEWLSGPLVCTISIHRQSESAFLCFLLAMAGQRIRIA